MQEEPNSSLTAYSSGFTQCHFSQKWHIADYRLLAELCEPGTVYRSCQFSHPCINGMVFSVHLYPNGRQCIPVELNESLRPSLFLHPETFTHHSNDSVTASYRVSSIADDGTATLLTSCSDSSYLVGGYGEEKMTPIKICREDGSLVLECTVTAMARVDQGIHGGSLSAKALAYPVPTFACILSNVAAACRNWHIYDVASYIGTCLLPERIEGPVFSQPLLDSIRWSLGFFPHGTDEEILGDISLNLRLKSRGNRSLKIKARFQFFGVFENGNQRKITDIMIREFKSDDDEGNTVAIDKGSISNFLRKDGSLLIKCELSTLIRSPSDARSTTVHPNLLVPSKQQMAIHKHTSDCMTKMVDTGYASDFVIKVGSTVFPVHRAVLGCQSNVLRAMLDSRLEEAISAELKISDFSADAVRLMVRYIYVGSLQNDSLGCHAKELVGLANKYDLPNLKEICEQKICSEIAPGNVVEAILLADKYNLSLLQGACLNLCRSSAKDEVIQSEDWEALKTHHPKVAFEFLEKL